MKTKEKILDYIRKNESVGGRELSEYLSISRQAVNKHLKELIRNGQVAKSGATRGAAYSIVSAGDRPSVLRKSWKKTCALAGLEEDKVFEEGELILSLRSALTKKAFSIVQYAFTEMVNNAIDHSHSRKCLVEITVDQYNVTFKVRDHGIGIFHSIFEKYGLSDEYAAIGELIKGKATTMRERHTGEGVFFTSRVADKVSFKSHKTNLVFDNLIDDILVEEPRFIKGTEVIFEISRRTKRDITKIFSVYAPEEYDYRFDRTRVVVKLFKEDYISRSEAKRLLARLEQFREVVLDFKGVKSISQGFVDEIFRVFRNQHPGVVIKTENVLPPLAATIKHVVDNKNIV